MWSVNARKHGVGFLSTFRDELKLSVTVVFSKPSGMGNEIPVDVNVCKNELNLFL